MPQRNRKTGIVRAATASTPASALAPASLGTVFKEGLVWGAGNAVAHQAIRSIFGYSGATATATVPTAAAAPSTEYMQCMKEFNDEAACKNFIKKE
jgi:hypothetical protein